MREVLAFSGFFEPGFRGGGPIRSLAHILDALDDRVRATVVTADHDLGVKVPYPGLSGQLVQRGNHQVYYWNWRDWRHWRRFFGVSSKRSFRLVYLNSLWDPASSLFPLLLWRLKIIRSPRLLIAPRGELTPGALSIKGRKKRLAYKALKRTLSDPRVLWHASTSREVVQIRTMFPNASVVIQPDTSGPQAIPEVLEPRDVPRIVFVGRISPMKNLDFALQALVRVNAPTVFHIFGPVEDVPYWRGCEALIERLPAHVECTYKGVLVPGQVQSTIAEYDAFLMPTRGENFGHVIAESLSAGCPVLCSDQTPWTEVLRDGGGDALPLDMDAWLATVAEVTNSPREVRSRRKVAALRAYESWQLSVPRATAIELALAAGDDFE